MPEGFENEINLDRSLYLENFISLGRREILSLSQFDRNTNKKVTNDITRIPTSERIINTIDLGRAREAENIQRNRHRLGELFDSFHVSESLETRIPLGAALTQLADLYPALGSIAIPRDVNPVAAERMREAVDGVAVLRQVLSALPPEDADSIISRVGENFETPEGKRQAAFLQALFNMGDSNELARRLKNQQINLGELPDLLFGPGINSILTVMLEHPEKYRMHLGVILSQVDIRRVPDELREKLAPLFTDLELDVKPEQGSWYLCSNAEPRLQTTMEDNSGLAVTIQDRPVFLVKFVGKLSALCLVDFATLDGRVFVKGDWYSPTDDDTRDALRTAFIDGKGRLDLQKGGWALMRPIKALGRKKEDEQIEDAIKYAGSLPDRFPTGDIIRSNGTTQSREEYLRTHKE